MCKPGPAKYVLPSLDAQSDNDPKHLWLLAMSPAPTSGGKAILEDELPFEALDINNLLREEDFESVHTGQLM